jgi:hypothetical protein
MLASELIPEFAAALQLIDELKAEGNTPDEIDEYLAECRRAGFEFTTGELRAAGMADEEIEAFWRALIPGDDPDGVDTIEEDS